MSGLNSNDHTDADADVAADNNGFRYFVTTAEELGSMIQEEGGGEGGGFEAVSSATPTEQPAGKAADGSGLGKVVNALEKHRNSCGEKFLNDYKYLRKLSQGDVASIKLYEDKGRMYAIKAVNKLQLARMKTYKSVPGGERMHVTTALERAREELDVLMTLPQHPGIIQLVEVIEDSRHHKIYMAFPYIEGGCLLNYSGSHRIYRNAALKDVFLVDTAKHYIFQMIEALTVLHERGIVHLDVKPENILLDRANKRCILTDFGSAKVLDEQTRVSGEIHGTHGTLAFLSPEACAEDVYNGYTADAWALAVTFHVSVYGVHPFDAVGQAELVDNISASDYDPPTLQRLEKLKLKLKLPLKAALKNVANAQLREAFTVLFNNNKEKQGKDPFFSQLSAVLNKL